jgi:hypothetical protein
MQIYIDDVLLPKAISYREVPMPNQTVLRTLANVVRVQFQSIGRKWEVGFGTQYVEENDILQAIWEGQYPGHSDNAPSMSIPSKGVEDVDVFISVTERNFLYNETIVEGYLFTIEEIRPR